MNASHLSLKEDYEVSCEELDILVDGPFMEAEKSMMLHFRGSRNQRIIDVPASLARGSVVLHELHEREE